MGINILLNIIPEKINPKEWSKVYEESIELLKKYPDEILGVKTIKTEFGERRLYSRDIENDIDNPEKRNWRIEGDNKNKKFAETFRLYYNINNYLKVKTKNINQVKDILLEKTPSKDNYTVVFSEKTQGCPYHSIILAIASLIETRFSPYALVSGNIDLIQSKEAINFANGVLKENVEMPVSVQPDKLFNRLSNFFTGKELIGMMTYHYRGKEEHLFQYIVNNFELNVVSEWFVEGLSNFKSPNQLGAGQLFILWLNHTQNLKRLCEMACLYENGPKFNPIEFMYTLINLWITVDSKKFDFIRNFDDKEGDPGNVNSMFRGMYLDLHLMGRKTNYYINEYALIEVFKEYFPELNDKLSNEIPKMKNKIKEIEEIIDEYKKKYDDLFKEIKIDDLKNGTPIYEDNRFMLFEKESDLTSRDYKNLKMVGFQFLEYEKQFKETFEKEYNVSIDEHDKVMNASFGRSATIHEKKIKFLKVYINSMMRKQHIILTEDAWEWIDKEDNEEILFLIMTVASINNDELNFWSMRLALFENRKLFDKVVEFMRDKDEMNKMSEIYNKLIKKMKK